jgi:hypothetical protein
MLLVLLLLAGLVVGFICHARRHFSKLLPPCRVDEQHGSLQVRRYPKLALAEVRVSGSTSLALRTGTHLLNKYFREEQIARFALPLLAEKVDAADSIWTMSVVLPMELEAAPAPRNKAIQLREQPPTRVIARNFHGSVSADDRLARQKAEMLPLVNDVCRQLGCTKLSTVVVMHRFPWWMRARRSNPRRRGAPPRAQPGAPFAADRWLRRLATEQVVPRPLPCERPDGARDRRRIRSVGTVRDLLRAPTCRACTGI